ncbi:MAG: site-specific integrase [Acidimicrobiales bacterium]
MLFLTAGQVRALAQAVQDHGEAARRRPPYGLLVEFAAFTGLRAGEIAALRMGDLDLRLGTVRVERAVGHVAGARLEGTPKTKAGRRTVEIPAFVVAQLKAELGDRVLDRDAPVFANANGQAFNYGTFYGLHFKPAVRRVLPAELHALRFHDLRHTYASFLVEQGAHPKEMAELMGHSSVQITLDRYAHVMPRMRTALAERLDAAYRDVEADEAPEATVAQMTIQA